MSVERTANFSNGINSFLGRLDVPTVYSEYENILLCNLSKLSQKNISEKKIEIESNDIINFIWEKEIIVKRSLVLDRVIYPKKIIFLVFLSVVFSVLLLPVFVYFNFSGNYLGKILSGGGFLVSSYVVISSLDQARLFKERDTV